MKTIDAGERVINGLAVLFEHDPLWWERVDLETLDMDSEDKNLLVQLFGSFKAAREILEIDLNVPLGWYGFRKMKWVHLHPTSTLARETEELEDKVWADVCRIWNKMIRENLFFLNKGGV